MPTTKCPLCGNDTLEEKHGEYRFAPPPNIPGGTIVIPRRDVAGVPAVWRGNPALRIE